MADVSFLSEFLLVLVVATFVAIIFDRLHLPSILGFLLAGVVIGPHGIGLLKNPGHIHQLAEMGVVLLMLTIGLEFSLDRLKALRKIAIIGGSFQILLSIGISLLLGWWKGWTLYQSFFFGSAIALSSTAIVLKHLIDSGELDAAHGRIAVSILIFQDFAVVPLIIFSTGIGQSPLLMMENLGVAFLKTALLIIGVLAFARYILPRFLREVATSRNREIFFLTAVVISLGIAWVSGQLGLSLAIGAFLAGFMFANTEYRHALIGDIVPFRYVFVSIFFVSIGLLFDLHFALANLGLVLGVVGLILVVNIVVVTLLVTALGYPPRVALASGLMLAQIGEFSFVLLEMSLARGGISLHFYHTLLSAAFITMLMTPFFFKLVPWLLRLSENISFFGVPPGDWKQSASSREQIMEEHVILCGYGPCGRDLAQMFQDEKIPFLLLEMNPRKIEDARKKKIQTIYGDAANIEVMKRAGIMKARSVVVSFGDPFGMVQMIRVVQSLNPEVMLIVRTRFEKEVARLYELGADIVVMEEWEASYELNRIVLDHFQIPSERVKKYLDRIHARKDFVIGQAILERATKRNQ